MQLLDGFRMVDLSRLAPGPNASRLLADMGMEVIKVEEPQDRWGLGRDTLTPASKEHEEQVRWAAYNALGRNKKSIAINLKDPKGKEVFYRLIRNVDVVLESYRPGVVQRLGVDYGVLSAINPQIIYCSISNFGQTGPYRSIRAHDAHCMAVMGVLALGSDEAGNPNHPGISVGDHGAALHAAMGILAALLARPRLGRGQFLDISIADCLTTFLPTWTSSFFRDGAVPRRGGHWPYQLSPLRCKDGNYVTIQISEQHFWEAFCQALGRPDFVPFRDPNHPEYPRVLNEVKRIFSSKSSEEWVSLLGPLDVGITPLLEFKEAFSSPHAVDREIVWHLQHPTAGPVQQTSFPIKFSETPAQFRAFAPLLGEHTDELMTSLGYSEEEVASLEHAGAIRGAAQRPRP